jgi:DNA-binding transcriptional LysR family regulator
MALNLHLLRMFATVAAHGNVSRAAAALHVSQPAVSRGVREFEAQIGTRLLERGARGVTLTEAGVMIQRHAAALFGAERAAEEDLAALRGLTRGTLVVGASTTIGTWYLPPLLAAFQHAHPAVALRLHNGNTGAIADLLLARELDIALVEGPVEQPGIIAQPWLTDRMGVIAASAHPKAGQALHPDALNDEIMILREPGSGTRDVVLAALAAHRITPRAMLEVGSTEMIKQMVVSGLGIAIVSDAAVRFQLQLGRLAALDVQGFDVTRKLNRLSLPERQPSPAAAAFDALLDKEGLLF